MASVNEMPVSELKKECLEDILKKTLGATFEVKGFKCKALTKPGENYGSTILAVEVKIADPSVQHLSLVAKLVPPTEFLRNLFRIDITFKKETNAYLLVAPEYKHLLQENGLPFEYLDLFPRFYGACINKEDDMTKPSDESAVILLENLKESGYVMGDRIEGLDLVHMRFATARLARFHATTVAIKLLKPHVFQKTVMEAAVRFVPGEIQPEGQSDLFVDRNIENVATVSACKPYLDKIRSVLTEQMNELPSEKTPQEPFAAMVHNDFWVNNMMFKYKMSQENSDAKSMEKVPIGIKILDFQGTTYDSPVRDLIFFLYTSAAGGILEEHFDDLLKLYHSEFVDCLKKLQCDASPFSLQRFMQEVEMSAPKEFTHILFMIKVITAKKEKVPDLSECTAADTIFLGQSDQEYENRMAFFILDYIKRGWL